MTEIFLTSLVGNQFLNSDFLAKMARKYMNQECGLSTLGVKVDTLSLKNVSKRFGGLYAVRDVNLDVTHGDADVIYFLNHSFPPCVMIMLK